MSIVTKTIRQSKKTLAVSPYLRMTMRPWESGSLAKKNVPIPNPAKKDEPKVPMVTPEAHLKSKTSTQLCKLVEFSQLM